MKKIVLVLAVAFGLTACGPQQDSDPAPASVRASEPAPSLSESPSRSREDILSMLSPEWRDSVALTTCSDLWRAGVILSESSELGEDEQTLADVIDLLWDHDECTEDDVDF
jgi:hypothetical protein